MRARARPELSDLPKIFPQEEIGTNMRTSLQTAFATAALLVPIARAEAQNVIGLTNKTPLVVRQSTVSCKTASCKPIGHVKRPHPASGGTAFDATRKGVWITSGKVISLVDPVNCKTLCRALLPIAGDATGLAMYEPKRILLIPSTAGIIYTVLATCPPRLLSRCSLKGVIPAGWTVGGIAVDDVRARVYFTASNFGLPQTPANILYAAPLAFPCKPVCKTELKRCKNVALSRVTGVAYDPCRGGTLYVTDGLWTVAYAVASSGNCLIRPVRCCPLKLISGDSYIGLAVLPSLSSSTGKSCTARPCPSCPSMRHELGGLPTLGNPTFSLDVVNAPRNAQAYMFVGLGPCASPGFPFGCGRIHVSLSPPGPFFLGGQSTGAGVACTGSAKWTLPIPANSALCGRTLSSQAFVLCRSAVGLGHGLTNCQTWTISGT